MWAWSMIKHLFIYLSNLFKRFCNHISRKWEEMTINRGDEDDDYGSSDCIISNRDDVLEHRSQNFENYLMSKQDKFITNLESIPEEDSEDGSVEKNVLDSFRLNVADNIKNNIEEILNNIDYRVDDPLDVANLKAKERGFVNYENLIDTYIACNTPIEFKPDCEGMYCWLYIFNERERPLLVENYPDMIHKSELVRLIDTKITVNGEENNFGFIYNNRVLHLIPGGGHKFQDILEDTPDDSFIGAEDYIRASYLNPLTEQALEEYPNLYLTMNLHEEPLQQVNTDIRFYNRLEEVTSNFERSMFVIYNAFLLNVLGMDNVHTPNFINRTIIYFSISLLYAIFIICVRSIKMPFWLYYRVMSITIPLRFKYFMLFNIFAIINLLLIKPFRLFTSVKTFMSCFIIYVIATSGPFYLFIVPLGLFYSVIMATAYAVNIARHAEVIESYREMNQYFSWLFVLWHKYCRVDYFIKFYIRCYIFVWLVRYKPIERVMLNIGEINGDPFYIHVGYQVTDDVDLNFQIFLRLINYQFGNNLLNFCFTGFCLYVCMFLTLILSVLTDALDVLWQLVMLVCFDISVYLFFFTAPDEAFIITDWSLQTIWLYIKIGWQMLLFIKNDLLELIYVYLKNFKLYLYENFVIKGRKKLKDNRVLLKKYLEHKKEQAYTGCVAFNLILQMFCSYVLFILQYFIDSVILRIVFEAYNIMEALIGILRYETMNFKTGFRTHEILKPLNWSLFRKRFVRLVRHNVTRMVMKVEEINVPRRMQGAYIGASKENIIKSLEILKELGWPVNVKIEEKTKEGETYFQNFKEWYMTSSNFKQPIRNLNQYLTLEAINARMLGAPDYRHTGSYTSVEKEIYGTSRYFSHTKEYENFDVIDDVWEKVYPHFENSKLAKTAHIVRKMVKKYSVGFGFMDPFKPRSMSRKVLMGLIGGEQKFVELFEETRNLASQIVPVAHVFTKFETLKESKWVNGLVRTIIGVPLSHYATTSLFSYEPNNRHPFLETPIKVGMPLTGAWFTDIWRDHAKRQFHFNGDFTNADSTAPKQMIDIVKAVRKRGFDGHKDVTAISELIDIAYEQLLTMPLAFKSTGDIAFKGTGGSTGHGNTSVDCSLYTLIGYMMAWKNITGKSAKEFNLYNTLSLQGDDHILSYDKNNFGWEPSSIIKEFSRIGMVLRDETGTRKLEDCAFLKKEIVKDKQNASKELENAGVSVPDYMTCHNKNALLGKLGAYGPLRNKQTRAKRLISYLWLTAHHKDVYLNIVDSIRKLQKNAKSDLNVKVPPYKAVLRAWYTKNPKTKTMKDMYPADVLDDYTTAEDAYADFIEEASVLHVHQPRGLEVCVIALSILPQVFSPRFRTNPAIRHIHKLLGDRVTWPIEFIKRRNPSFKNPGVISSMLDRTKYDFLNGNDLYHKGSSNSTTTLFIKHYLFMIINYLFIGYSSRITSILYTFDVLLANMYFLLFGQMVQYTQTVDYGYRETLLLVIIDILVPDIFPEVPIPYIPTFTLSSFIIIYITEIWKQFSPNGNIDFEQIEDLCNTLRFIGSKNIISAPTGVGKSTRLIKKIADLNRLRKIYVIEPRHILVVGLQGYMSSIDTSRGYGGATVGMTPSPFDQVIYCTYQSFVMSKFGNPEDIIIIDEAHVDDPVYQFGVEEILKRSCTVILTTATPDPIWQVTYPEMKKIDLLVESTFRVVEDSIMIDDISEYMDEVERFVRCFSTNDKAIVFVPTIKIGEKIAERIACKSTLISSKHTEFDKNADVFITTRVTDAGVTLPDVNFVLSMDIEFGVSTPNRVEFNVESNQYYYRLDELTLKQRKGRTGRTCDGTFIKYRVIGDYNKRQATDMDLLQGLSQLLDFRIVRDNLSESAKVLFEQYDDMIYPKNEAKENLLTISDKLNLGLTPQNVMGDETHRPFETDYSKQRMEQSILHGQTHSQSMIGLNPLVAIEPRETTLIETLEPFNFGIYDEQEQKEGFFFSNLDNLDIHGNLINFDNNLNRIESLDLELEQATNEPNLDNRTVDDYVNHGILNFHAADIVHEIAYGPNELEDDEEEDFSLFG